MDQRFAFKNSRISCLALIRLDIQLEQSEKDSPVRKKIGSRWRNTKSHIPFFLEILISICGSVIKMSSSEYGDLGSSLDEC